MHQEILTKYVDSRRQIDDTLFRSLLNQQTSNQPASLERFYKDILETFGWKAANPSIAKRVEEIERLYCEPRSGLSDKLTRILIAAAQKKPFLIVGKRGSGKTALCNYVLSVNFNKLQENDVTWLRCDVAKLHSINEELIEQRRIDPKLRWTINDYMALHGFSVMIEYGEKDAVFSKLMAGEAGWGENPDLSPIEIRLRDIDPGLAETWRFIRMIDSERRKLVQLKRLNKEKDQDIKWFFQKLYSHVRGELASRLYTEVINCIEDRYLEETGRHPKIVLLFDGVDNIRNDEHAPVKMQLAGRSARVWYLEYLEEIRQYLTYAGTALPADKYVIVIRCDTEVDLGVVERANQHRNSEDDPRIDVVCPDLKDSFLRKLGYLRDADVCCFEGGEGIGKTERLDTFEWFHDEFIKLHGGYVSQGARDKTARDMANDVLRVVFNDNLRSFNRNLIRSFAYFTEFCLKAPDFDKQKTVEDRRGFYKNHVTIALEASILAGNKYMRHNFDKASRGRWCPNYFEFSPSSDNRWNGLVLHRVLQAIPMEPSDVPRPTESQLEKRLGKIGYNSETVRLAVYTALEFGLIALDAIVYEPTTQNREFTLVKTEKGGYLPEFVFSRLNILYVVATGGVFAGIKHADTLSVGNSPYLHRAGDKVRLFHSSAVRLGALLLQHVNTAHRRDVALLSLADPDLTVFVAPNIDSLLAHSSVFISEAPSGDQRMLRHVFQEFERATDTSSD